MAELAILAAGAAGASAGAVGTIGTIASVGLTAASAFSSIQAGNQQAASLNIQARQSQLNARAERLQGKQQALAIQTQLERDLSSQNALFGARGILQGEGSAAAAASLARSNATRDIDVARFNSDIGALNSEQAAANARSDAGAARTQGFANALTTISSYKSVPSFGRTGGSSLYSRSPGGTIIPGRKPSLVG